MSRSWKLYLRDMLECAAKVERFTSGLDLAHFVADEKAYVDWRGIASLRDVLAHAYFALDDATLWRIVNEDVRRLRPELERIVRENPPDPS